MGLPLALLVVEGVAAVGTAYAQKQSGDFAAAQAKRKADADQRAANEASLAGNVEAQKIFLQGGYTKGMQRAGFAAGGVETNSGSPLELVADTALFTKLDAATTQANAERQAAGFEGAAGDSLLEGAARRRAGNLNAAGSLLSGFGNVAGDYYHLRDAGAFKVPS